MTKSEINSKIHQLEKEISEAENRRAEAERNIRQLTALAASCNDYQAEFEAARTVRKIRLGDVNEILGQAKFVSAYGGEMGELVNGSEYMNAYGGMDTAKSEISREIERQKQIISECNSRISGSNSSINYWCQQLANADKEVRNAGYGINYR